MNKKQLHRERIIETLRALRDQISGMWVYEANTDQDPILEKELFATMLDISDHIINIIDVCNEEYNLFNQGDKE